MGLPAVTSISPGAPSPRDHAASGGEPVHRCTRVKYSYKRVKGRSHTVEKRKASQPQNTCEVVLVEIALTRGFHPVGTGQLPWSLHRCFSSPLPSH